MINLAPSRSGVRRGPSVSQSDVYGELGAVARRGDARPVLRAPDGGVLGPCGSRRSLQEVLSARPSETQSGGQALRPEVLLHRAQPMEGNV